MAPHHPVTAATALLLIGLLSASPSSCIAASTDSISNVSLASGESCFSGYVMDYFCIKRGTFLDRPDLESLRYPAEHTIHCLVDVPMCVESGYQMLVPDEAREGWYKPAFKLDSFGNGEVVRLAKEDREKNNATKGFQVTVIGKVDELTTPPTVQVVSVHPISTKCPASSSMSPPS